MKRSWLCLFFVVLAFGGCDPGEVDPDPPAPTLGPDPDDANAELDSLQQVVCRDHNPERNVYFGDLHLHTAYSFDAYGYGTRTRPRGAYRFAKGEPVELSPLHGHPRWATIDRPLDFVAVTDHSEWLAQSGNAIFGKMPNPANHVWKLEQGAAEAAYDRSSNCSFTSFVAYEWTAMKGNTWWHRNVIFRSKNVPEMPISSTGAEQPRQLWASLEAKCVHAGTGCDAIAIPHNSNCSHGVMFNVPDDISPSLAATRQRMEPLAEIYQHKGSSECAYGVGGSTDPLCSFEQNFPIDCVRNPDDPNCNFFNFVRNGLRRGLRVEHFAGTNPLKLGIVASTDTHNATPGATEEWYPNGQVGAGDADPRSRIDPTKSVSRQSQGGLTAVWAEQNQRGALFNALKRRETYGTSGTRIKVRFFGGWNYPTNLCSRADLVRVGYEHGVPMGGDLPAHPGGAQKPSFVVWAHRDPGTEQHPGTQLQRLQIVKGWLDQNTLHSAERVYDVAGEANNGASVDTNSCQTHGPGNDSMCVVFSDPDFNPAESAFYYVRVLENPSCSSRQHACNSLPAGSRPPSCTDDSLARVIQERAWTSPIWYKP